MESCVGKVVIIVRLINGVKTPRKKSNLIGRISLTMDIQVAILMVKSIKQYENRRVRSLLNRQNHFFSVTYVHWI